jgi:integrase
MYKRNKQGRKVADDEPGIYYLQYQTNGKVKLTSLKTDDKKKAEKRRTEILQPALMLDTKAKVVVHIAEARKIINDKKHLLTKVWDEYEDSSSRPLSAAGTLRNHKRHWDSFRIWILFNKPGFTTLNEITKVEAQEFSDFLWKKKITEDTFRYYMVSLKLIYKHVMNVTETPFDGIKKEKAKSIGRLDFTQEQILKIHEELDKPDFHMLNKPEMKLLCYIGQYTGLRLIDAVKLECRSINLDKDNVCLSPVKTIRRDKIVSIPIHPEFKAILGSVDLTGEYVLPAMAKRYSHNPDGIKNDFMRLLAKAGLDEEQSRDRGLTRKLYGYHSYRHTFCSMMASAGVPIAILGSMLGDNIRTLERYYVKINSASQIEAINSLSSVKPVSELEKLNNRIQNACKAIESANISDNIKAELLKLLQS